MAGSPLPLVGLVLLLVGLSVAALTFVFILTDMTGEFPARIAMLNAATSLIFVVGGAGLRFLPR